MRHNSPHVAPGIACGALGVWAALWAVRRIALLSDEQTRERLKPYEGVSWYSDAAVQRSLAAQVLPLFRSSPPATVDDVAGGRHLLIGGVYRVKTVTSEALLFVIVFMLPSMSGFA
eukprot:gene4892-3271_t